MWVVFVRSTVCSVFGSVFAEEPVLGDRCKEPCKVLIVQLVCVGGASCLFDEGSELSQLAGGVSIPKGLWAGLAAN